jgi:tRNA threonylcarbamoyladenosine biosynthesis protein TsaE
MHRSVQPTTGAGLSASRPSSRAQPDAGAPGGESLTILDLPDEQATRAVASRLAEVVRGGDVLALWGGLGVGKTVFARALVQARAGTEIEVPSPTFTLVQIYEGLGPDAADLFHFDLYRIDAPEDALELGIEEAFAGGIALIEWPDRLGPFLPAGRLDLVFADVPGRVDARQMRLAGDASWRQRLVEAGLA